MLTLDMQCPQKPEEDIGVSRTRLAGNLNCQTWVLVMEPRSSKRSKSSYMLSHLSGHYFCLILFPEQIFLWEDIVSSLLCL